MFQYKNITKTLSILSFLVLILSSCEKNKENSYQKLTVAKAYVTKDNEGKPTTETANLLAEDLNFHCLVQMNKKEAGAKVTVNLIAVAAENYENYEVRTLDQTTDKDSILDFSFSLARPWFKGKYRCDIYVNDTLIRNTEFVMQ